MWSADFATPARGSVAVAGLRLLCLSGCGCACVFVFACECAWFLPPAIFCRQSLALSILSTRQATHGKQGGRGKFAIWEETFSSFRLDPRSSIPKAFRAREAGILPRSSCALFHFRAFHPDILSSGLQSGYPFVLDRRAFRRINNLYRRLLQEGFRMII